MMIRASVPIEGGVGAIELSTETTDETITIRIGDVTATVKRIDLVDAVGSRLAPAFVPFDPGQSVGILAPRYR